MNKLTSAGLVMGALLIICDRFFVRIPDVPAILLYGLCLIMIIIGMIKTGREPETNDVLSKKDIA